MNNACIICKKKKGNIRELNELTYIVNQLRVIISKNNYTMSSNLSTDEFRIIQQMKKETKVISGMCNWCPTNRNTQIRRLEDELGLLIIHTRRIIRLMDKSMSKIFKNKVKNLLRGKYPLMLRYINELE